MKKKIRTIVVLCTLSLLATSTPTWALPTCITNVIINLVCNDRLFTVYFEGCNGLTTNGNFIGYNGGATKVLSSSCSSSDGAVIGCYLNPGINGGYGHIFAIISAYGEDGSSDTIVLKVPTYGNSWTTKITASCPPVKLNSCSIPPYNPSMPISPSVETRANSDLDESQSGE